MKNKSIINWMIHRVKKNNQNVLGLICGQTGSGKSYAALKIAEAIDPNFNLNNVAFTPIEFMELVNNKKIKKGSVIIWDESGVGYDARAFASRTNKLLNHIMETFRNKNLIILMTTPSLDFIDVNARKLLHIYFETVRVDRDKKLCTVKPFIVSYSPRAGKYYMKYPYKLRNKLTRLHIGLASKELLRAYEKRKKVFTDELNEKVLAKLKLQEKPKEKDKPFEPRDYLDKAKKLEKITIPRLRAEFGLSRPQANMVRSLLP
jgi:ABC-type dipeptide/oligopeptide/nickel transport system ATPase component